MEVLNNVQLEGRRINVEISKMMVAEDVITTEEVQVVVLVEEVLLQEEKETAPRREGSGGGFRSDRSAPREGGFAEEVQLHVKVVLEEEVQLQEEKVLQTEHQDVLKALVMHLDQEDQEETNV
jgi:hypothetical protein